MLFLIYECTTMHNQWHQQKKQRSHHITILDVHNGIRRIIALTHLSSRCKREEWWETSCYHTSQRARILGQSDETLNIRLSMPQFLLKAIVYPFLTSSLPPSPSFSLLLSKQTKQTLILPPSSNHTATQHWLLLETGRSDATARVIVVFPSTDALAM